MSHYIGIGSYARFLSLMTILGQLRRRPQLIRSVFAMFVLAWLQTALLPCAMAMTHVSQVAQVMISHSNELSASAADTAPAAMADMLGCPYCPALSEQAPFDAATMHGCFYPHESRMDGGTAHQAQLDQLVLQPIFIVSPEFHFALDPHHSSLPQYQLAHISQRPFTLTYCVQLK